MDTVSGATFSSRGIIAAVRSALSQAAVSDNTTGNNTDKQGAAEVSGNGQTDEIHPAVHLNRAQKVHFRMLTVYTTAQQRATRVT